MNRRPAIPAKAGTSGATATEELVFARHPCESEDIPRADTRRASTNSVIPAQARTSPRLHRWGQAPRKPVIPAKAGIHFNHESPWIPAFAGMTEPKGTEPKGTEPKGTELKRAVPQRAVPQRAVPQRTEPKRTGGR